MWRIWYSRQMSGAYAGFTETSHTVVEADSFEEAADQVPEGWAFVDAIPLGIGVLAG